jgi:hypothetical protein
MMSLMTIFGLHKKFPGLLISVTKSSQQTHEIHHQKTMTITINTTTSYFIPQQSLLAIS